MAYTALEEMQKLNGNAGNPRPAIPDLATGDGCGSLAWCALMFLRENCQDLRFNTAASLRNVNGDNIRTLKDSYGLSYSKEQIPYLMQMDIDRLCLEQTLGDFLTVGTTHAAYLVYFCYLEMFLGGAQPNRVRKMIELLSEFEKNASPLVSGHRDHFVHSVYVFAIGLAIYRQSPLFREAYRARYSLPEGGVDAAQHFLAHWGFTALFHDLGYPFELAFEQVKDYFKDSDIPAFHICYRKKPENHTADRIFAKLLAERLYPAFHKSVNYQTSLRKERRDDNCDAFYRYLLDELQQKPGNPQHFNGYMDHAYFSAYLMLYHLGIPDIKKGLKAEEKDALAAILMHNSLLKYTIMKDENGSGNDLRLEMQTLPLAYLLMLCDELQCWNRFGYGKKARNENNPIECELTFRDNSITAKYFFDSELAGKKTGVYKKFLGSSRPYAFLNGFTDYLRINTGDDTLQLTVDMGERKRPQMKGEPLSECNFFNTYRLAVQLNAEYQSRDGYNGPNEAKPRLSKYATEEEWRAAFNALSLEYKLANFYQVQQFADHLSRIGCFFTDRQVDFAELEEFTDEQLEKIGRWEHDAWAARKRAMGWRPGKSYCARGRSDAEQNKFRERLREHQYLDVSFDSLPPDKKKKDKDPIVRFQHYMKANYRVRIYILNREEPKS